MQVSSNCFPYSVTLNFEQQLSFIKLKVRKLFLSVFLVLSAMSDTEKAHIYDANKSGRNTMMSASCFKIYQQNINEANLTRC